MKERKTNQTKNNDNSKTKNCTLGIKKTKYFTLANSVVTSEEGAKYSLVQDQQHVTNLHSATRLGRTDGYFGRREMRNDGSIKMPSTSFDTFPYFLASCPAPLPPPPHDHHNHHHHHHYHQRPLMFGWTAIFSCH